MIGICVFSLSETYEYAKKLGVFECFGAREEQRIEAISNLNARSLSLGGVIALKRLVDEFKLSGDEMTISRDGFGKPYFESRGDVSFSISHATEISVAALATRGVGGLGVDIERIDTSKRTERISERFFSDREKLRIRDADDSLREFYRIWTAKEALVKLGGKGLSSIADCDSIAAEEGAELYFSRYSLSFGTDEYILTLCSSWAENVKIICDDVEIDLCEI